MLVGIFDVVRSAQQSLCEGRQQSVEVGRANVQEGHLLHYSGSEVSVFSRDLIATSSSLAVGPSWACESVLYLEDLGGIPLWCEVGHGRWRLVVSDADADAVNAVRWGWRINEWVRKQWLWSRVTYVERTEVLSIYICCRFHKGWKTLRVACCTANNAAWQDTAPRTSATHLS